MIEFAPAVRTNTAIVLALAGASGSGKTLTALLLAAGLAGDGKTMLIDSEGDRGLHYAPAPGEAPDYVTTFLFEHNPWRPPFTPESLGAKLREADARGFKVVVVDSASDEHEGEGGLVDMAEAELQAQIKRGWESNTASAWARPKAAHKHHIVRWLRQARCHVIFCLRAQEKVRFEQVTENGRRRTKVVPIGWTPICEKNLLYDVTTSLLFVPWTDTKLPDPRGKPLPIKLYSKHAPFFPLDRQVSREAGKRLAEWAAGGHATVTPPDRPAAPLGETERKIVIERTGYDPAIGRATKDPSLPGPDQDALRADLNATAESKASKGSAEFRAWWAELPRRERALIRGFVARYQGIALEADRQAAAASDEAPGGKATTAAAAG